MILLLIIIIFIVTIFIWVRLLNNFNEENPITHFVKSTRRTENFVDLIQHAINSNKKLKIVYKSSYLYKSGEETCRVIQPLELKFGNEIIDNDLIKFSEFAQDNLYLKAYCELRKEERHFRLDRIRFIQIIEK